VVLGSRVKRGVRGRAESAFPPQLRNEISAFISGAAANEVPISINIIRQKFGVGLDNAKAIMAQVAAERKVVRAKNGVSRVVVAKFMEKKRKIKEHLRNCAKHQIPVSVRDLKKDFGGGWTNLKAIMDETSRELARENLFLVRKEAGASTK
jgi:hypothetical protein